MRFFLNPNARKAIEKSVGVSCAELQMKSLSRFHESKSSCSHCRFERTAETA